MLKKIILICILLCFLVHCRQNNNKLQQSFIAFDTIVTITIIHPSLNEEDFDQVISGLKKSCERYDLIFNKYNKQSAVYKLQKLRTGQLYKIDRELFYVLKNSQKYYYLTQGLFDVSIGRVTGLYNFHKNIIPDDRTLAANLKYIGMDKIILTNQQIQFLQPGMNIDLGAVAKGYIIDALSADLLSRGFKDFIVNIGGDLYASGRNQKKKWNIGIRHPKDLNNIIDKIELSNKAVVTSGDYERYVLRKRKKYHHILNPRTGLPVWNNIVSVTIIAENTMLADFLATAVFVMGKDRGIRLINKNFDNKIHYIIFEEQNNKIKKHSDL